MEKLTKPFNQLTDSVIKLNKSIKIEKDILTDLQKQLQKLNITNYHCPVCKNHLLYEYETSMEIILYCMECEKRIKVKK